MDIQPCRWPQRAFTLIELITTLAVMLIMLSLGVPQLRTLQANSSLTSASHDILTHLQYARNEAIMRGSQVVLCPSSDRQRCSNDHHWERGFMVYVDENHNRRHEPGEPLLRYHLPDASKIQTLTTTGRRRLVFKPSGMSPGSTATITLCDDNQAVPPRAVILSNPGRPRLSRTRPDGSPLVCG